MNPMSFNNAIFAPLFADTAVEHAFSTEQFCASFLAFEVALTRALKTTHTIPQNTADIVLANLASFQPDIAAISAQTLADGLPIPAFVQQLKNHVGADAATTVHIGATSQDLIDTAMIIAIRDMNKRMATALTTVEKALEGLSTQLGTNALMGRTRMQAALPITAADRITSWTDPLSSHAKQLVALRPRLERVQFGGPVGKRAMPENDGDKIANLVAAELGLHPSPNAWHTQRAILAEYAGWLAMVTGSLGKMGQDICLMSQQGIDEITLQGGGTSSAMPHKQNPVLAELLVTFARYNAVQISGMHQAMVHEQERSGSAWTLEWMILPSMVGTTMQALNHANNLVAAITGLGQR